MRASSVKPPDSRIHLPSHRDMRDAWETRTHLGVDAGKRGGIAAGKGIDEASGKGGDEAGEIDIHGNNGEEDYSSVSNTTYPLVVRRPPGSI